MNVRIALTDTFDCSLERAFKAPILGDATKFLNGYQLQPPVVAFEDDESWGQVGGIRFPISNGNFIIAAGRMCKDEVLERQENISWKWTIYNFETRALYFATKAVGEWYVIPNEDDRIEVTYIYTYTSRNIFCHPINWLYMHLQNKGMMKKAIKGIKSQAESGKPFIYECEV